MIVPKKPSSVTQPLPYGTEAAPENRKNVAPKISSLDGAPVSHFRHFFELLDQLDRQQIKSAGSKLSSAEVELVQSGTTTPPSTSPSVDNGVAA